MTAPAKRRSPRRDRADPEVLARLFEIPKESDEHLILANGPVSPDAALLDQAAEALHLMVRADLLWSEGRELRFGKNSAFHQGSTTPPEVHARADTLSNEAQALIKKAKRIMRAVGKVPAKTAAGIYAKALIVRGSRTGAEVLARSLATDLVALPALRAMLWHEGTGR